MEIEIRVPTLPESVSDATLVTWHKQPGDTVQRDENLVDLETDKVVLEIPAPKKGRIQKILKSDGEVVTSNELIAVIEPLSEDSAANVHVLVQENTKSKEQLSAPSSSQEATHHADHFGPAVRRLISEHALDPNKIIGTGKSGRLTKTDVINHIQSKEAQPAETTAPKQAIVESIPSAKSVAPSAESLGNTRRVAMSRLRARIAQRMVEAQQTTATLTTFNEVDMQQIITTRKKYQETFQKQHDTKLGFMSFFVKACVEALIKYPIINASVEADDILYHDHYDIGIAVASPRGLVVPVLKDADHLSIASIEKHINDFGVRARDGSLTIEDLSGGTFTITNGGVFGSLLSTPILNPPQSAILGMHKIQERPVVVDGEVCVRPIMYLALSYDHRIIDGKDAVQFLVAIKNALEDPMRLLLAV